MGQKFAAYDNSGNIVAYYDDEINPASQISVQSIEITDEQWQASIDSPGAYMVDVTGKAIINTPAPSVAQALTAVRTAKSAEISAACKAAIYAGFTSNALGAAYHYPAEDRDQMNLTACVTQSYNPALPTGWAISFYCSDASGAWEKRPHTAVQIQQVGTDGINAIQSALNKNDSLQQQIAAATTVDAVNAIVWS